MQSNLVKGNIIRREGDNLIYFNRAVETWIDSDEFIPDESKVIDIDELAELDNGILLDSMRGRRRVRL